MIAAHYITKYPALFLKKDMKQMDLFLKNELGRSNRPLKKTIAKCLNENLFLNEKFFKMIRIFKLWDIDPDSCSNILETKFFKSLRDEYSPVMTGHLWLDYYLLREKPNIGPIIISYPSEIAEEQEFKQLLSLFVDFKFFDIEDDSQIFKPEKKAILKVKNKNLTKLIEETYFKNYKNTIVLSEEVEEKAHLRLEKIGNTIFLNVKGSDLVPLKELFRRANPPKQYLNISGYDLDGKMVYDMDQYMNNQESFFKSEWKYFSYFIQDDFFHEDLKYLKNIYSIDRLKLMLQKDLIDVDLNKMSILLRNLVRLNNAHLLPKKPRDLADLKAQMMILQLTDADYKSYKYPAKILGLDNCEFGEYKILVPKNRKELIHLSRLMKNCLYQPIWDDTLSNNKLYIIILLKNNKPLFIISFDEKGQIDDYAGIHNIDMDESLVEQISREIIPKS